MSIGTSTFWPSSDQTGSRTFSTADSADISVCTCSAAAFASARSSWPESEPISTDSVTGSASPASLISSAARPDWPTRKSASVAVWVGTVTSRAMDAATKTTHRPIARHGCVALQIAIRTVTGCLPVRCLFITGSPRRFGASRSVAGTYRALWERCR